MEKNCLVFITVLIGQKEGLPNITGQFGHIRADDNAYWISATKAFSYTTVSRKGVNGNDFVDGGLFSFDASKGETKTDGTLKTDSEHKVYGSSNHVTPCNATIKVWQRIS